LRVNDNSFSDRYIKTKDEVAIFLERVKQCLDDNSRWMINNEPWTGGRVNKTQLFLAEKNLKDNDVAEIIRELQVVNYCYTTDDKNKYFSGETFWIFGITKYVIDAELRLYIKLKIRKIETEVMLIMSFHPEQPSYVEDELTFPYAL